MEPRNVHFQQVHTPQPHSEEVPWGSPLRTTPSAQLALPSDLWCDPLLKINFNLFLPHLSPPEESEAALSTSDMETCLLFLRFLQEAPRTRRGIIFRENWVPSVSQHYSFNNFYQRTEMRAGPYPETSPVVTGRFNSQHPRKIIRGKRKEGMGRAHGTAAPGATHSHLPQSAPTGSVTDRG